MDSKPLVSLSTARPIQQANSGLSTSTSTGSFLIRAPLTIDDDDEDNSSISESTSARNIIFNDSSYGSSNNSISSNGSEGFLSDEEFESASERQFVADPGEEIFKESRFDDKYKFSRPLVAVPDEEFSQKSIVSDEESGVGDEYYGPVVDLALVDSVNLKPIAHLSMDDDSFENDELSGGDEGLISEGEEGGFSPVVKVASRGRVDSAPRIKVMEIEGEGEPLSELPLPEDEKFADSLIPRKFDGVGNLDLSISAESFLVNSFTDASLSAEPVQGRGNGEDVFEFVKKSVELGPELENSVQEKVGSNDLYGPENEEHSAGIADVSGQAFVPILNHVKELKVEEAGVKVEGSSAFQNNQRCGIDGFEETFASSSLAESEDSQDLSQSNDGQAVIDTDDELDTERCDEGNELSDSSPLVALLKSVTNVASEDVGLTINPTVGSKIFTHELPTGPGTSFPSVSRGPPPNVGENVHKDNISEEERMKTEKIQLLRVKFLRLVQRLGHSFDDSIVAQVLYRLALTSRRHSAPAFSLESAKREAVQREAEDKADLDFSLNILVLGKTGVGKSATINSIFSEEKAAINAFEPATTSVKVIAGRVHGVEVTVLDTPGLRSPAMEQTVNKKILASIKKSVRKFPPDVVLYVDRLDTHTKDLNDLPLLKSLTGSLSLSIWQNAIVCLTHAASDPPDGPSGLPVSYEMFVAQRSRVIQQSISQAVGELHLMNPSMMRPVSLVENHQSCQKNGIGESVLPNGQSWRPQLLLLCFSLKILSQLNLVSKPQDPFANKKLFGVCCSAPLSYFLSLLLQSRTHPKLSVDHGGDYVDSDVGLGDSSDSEQEDEDEYAQLPPFKPLRKSQVAQLSKEQQKAYFEEYDYRIKLLQNKQWKEEVKQSREMKKNGNVNNYDQQWEFGDPKDESPATVPVALPDFVLPPSFDGDNPAYRYRFLEPIPQFLMSPVLDSHSWDHDCGYDGVSLEGHFAIASQFPGAFALQITKDKKEFSIHLDSSISSKYGENGSTMAGLDIQTVGRQLAYVFRGETKFRNSKINKTSGGLSITLLGENVATGLKIEDQIAVGKRLILSGNAGAVQSGGDTAYGANLELRLKDKDFPTGKDNSSLGLSMMNWRGDQSLTANLQSQFSIGRSSIMAIRVGLNKQRSGQINVKLSSSEQLQMALIGILPIVVSLFRIISPGSGGQKTMY